MLGTLQQSSTFSLNVTSLTFRFSAYILNIGDLNAQCPTSAVFTFVCLCIRVSGLTSLSRAAQHSLGTERKGERVNKWSRPVSSSFATSCQIKKQQEEIETEDCRNNTNLAQ